MTKELQDLAWSLLPKEFKEEVKNQFRDGFNDDRDAIGRLFGIDNLLSDADGEEMLYVPRKKVVQRYADTNKGLDGNISNCEEYFLNGKLTILKNLFGSKCLPDEEPQPKFHKGDRVKVITDCWKDKVYTVNDVKGIYPQFSYKLSCSPDNWFAESTLELAKEPKSFKYKVGQKVILHFYGGEVSTITEAFNDGGVWNKYKVKMLLTRVWNENELDPYEEPKPAEPKFKRGDKVKDISSPHDGGIYKVDDIKKSSDGFIYHIQGLIGKSNVKESTLEPYTEPEEPTCTRTCTDDCPSQSRNLSQETANCDKCNDRRLHIAAMAMQGIMSASDPLMFSEKGCLSAEAIARQALKYAEALIAESEKGGRNEKV